MRSVSIFLSIFLVFLSRKLGYLAVKLADRGKIDIFVEFF